MFKTLVDMKKTFSLFPLLFLFLLSASSYAQSIGPKAGVNIASYAGDDQFDDDAFGSNTGLQFGVAAEIPISGRFAIQPELLYLQKGAASEVDFLGITTRVENVLNYLEIPLLAKISLTDSPTKVYVTAGPSIGFGLGGKVVTSVGDMEEEVDVDFEEDELNSFDLSLAFGAGVQFEVGPGQLFVDARYLLGLGGLDDSEPEADQIDIFNRGIGASVGFLFPIGQ